jgi:hypothetical protein
MKTVVWGLVLLLVVIHQDLWFWNDDRLVFGFVPITLAYHAGISLAAGFVWFLAINFAWPEGLDDEVMDDPVGTHPRTDVAPHAGLKGGAA